MQLFMTLQEETTAVQYPSTSKGPRMTRFAQITQLVPNHLNVAVAGYCQQRASVHEKFLLHGGDVNSPVFSPPLPQSLGHVML